MAKIEKLNFLEFDVFHKEYFKNHIPIIVKGLFDKAKIASISNENKLTELLGEEVFSIRKEYVANFVETLSFSQEAQQWPLKEYLTHIKQEPASKLCIIQPIKSQKLMSFFSIPEYCHVRKSSLTESNIFIGRKQHITHMHYDIDYKHILLYQVFGSKKILLVPTTYSTELYPLMHISPLFTENWSAAKKQAFITNTDAYECILDPGEILYIPAAMWHQIEYLDTGMSINFTFGSNDFNDFLFRNVHSDIYTQNIATKFDALENDQTKDSVLLHCFTEIKTAVANPSPNAFEKYKQIRDLIKSWNSRLNLQPTSHEPLLESLIDVLIESNNALRHLAERRYKRPLKEFEKY